MPEEIRIERWHPEYRDDFIRLNKEWIERYFCLEPCDIKILGDPEGQIIRQGGEIFFALLDGKVVGCCALIFHPDDGRYELAKMAVAPEAQGKGLGYRLGATLVEYAREHRIPGLFLEANTKLEASIGLYNKLGFRKAEKGYPAYSRCNLYMEMRL